MIKIIGIKTNDGYYITDNLGNNGYFSSAISDKIVNNEKVQKTFHKDWYKVKSEPIKIQKYVSQPSINKRYELKDSTLADKLKPVYLYEDVVEYIGDEINYKDNFDSIIPLYEYKYDVPEPVLEDVEFEYNTITEIEEIKEPNHLSYKRAGQWSYQQYNQLTDSDIKFDMISAITVPTVIIHEAPCNLTQKATYDIIRAYVKDNINPKIAQVTSDYDFCFTVEKKVTLAKEHVYQVDINDSFFGKRKSRKPKYETRVQKTRSVKVFEMCHEKYQSYTPITPFKAESQNDLKELIDNYLLHLISVINEPLCECDKCNGTGVVFDKP